MTEGQKCWPVASPGPSASLLPKRGGASLNAGSHGAVLSQPQGNRGEGTGWHTCPFHPGGTEGRLQTQSSRNPPGPAASTELPSGPPPPDPWPRMEPGQMVEAQTWDPSPKTAQALSYGHRIREALPWVWAWKIFRCKRLGKHLLILITKILSFSAPRNLNLFFQLQL